MPFFPIPLDLFLAYFLVVPLTMFYVTIPAVLAAIWLGWMRVGGLTTVWAFSALVVMFSVAIMFFLDFELRRHNAGSGAMAFLALPHYVTYIAMLYSLVGFTIGTVFGSIRLRIVRA